MLQMWFELVSINKANKQGRREYYESVTDVNVLFLPLNLGDDKHGSTHGN